MSDQRLLDFYNEAGNQYRIYAAAVIAVAAGMLFLCFLVGLRETLLAADGPSAGRPLRSPPASPSLQYGLSITP